MLRIETVILKILEILIQTIIALDKRQGLSVFRHSGESRNPEAAASQPRSIPLEGV